MRTALLFLFVLPSFAAAQPREAAELFPPSTVAYAELRDPAAIADTLAAIVKGTPLEDGLKFLHDRKDANKDARLFHGSPGLTWAAVLASPEMLAEVRKFRGAAVGFLGLTKANEPKIAACALLGDSTAAALMVKLYLANEATFRRVDAIDGVPVYQSRAIPTTAFDPNTGNPIPFEAKRATEGPCEPTFAYVPGLFIVASNKESIAEILARHRGTAKDSLAGTADFAAHAGGRSPGVNLFVRLAELVKVCDAAKKAKKDAIDPTALAYLKMVVNAKAAPILTGNIAVRPDGFAISLNVPRDAKQPSPLLDLLDGTVPGDSLRVYPSNVAGGFTVALPAKPKRAAAALALADAIAKAEGEIGMLPTEWIGEMEKSAGLSIREKYLPNIRAVSLVFAPKQELPARVEPWPMLALHLEPDAFPAEWEAAIPKWFAAVAGLEKPVAPSSETINGVKVWTLPRAGGAAHYARSESTWVFGLDRKQVAACCAAENRATALKAPGANDAAVAAGVPLGLMQYESIRRVLGRIGGPAAPGAIDFGVPFGGGFLPPGILDAQATATVAAFSPEENKKLFGTLPPFAARAFGGANRLTFEMTWEFGPPGAKGFVEKMIPILEKIGPTETNPYLRGFPYDR